MSPAESSGMGSTLPLELTEQLSAAGDGVSVGVGVGGQYLVVEVASACGPCWVCAPASERAIDCVRTGRSSPWSVVHHSCTGTVAVFAPAPDGSLRESVLLCSALPAGRAAPVAA